MKAEAKASALFFVSPAMAGLINLLYALHLGNKAFL